MGLWCIHPAKTILQSSPTPNNIDNTENKIKQAKVNKKMKKQQKSSLPS